MTPAPVWAAAPAPETGNKVALASAALAELGYTASEISAAMKGIPAQELPVEETVRRCPACYGEPGITADPKETDE